VGFAGVKGASTQAKEASKWGILASAGCMCSVIVYFLYCICVCDCDGRHE
jgi:hypothetical protein